MLRSFSKTYAMAAWRIGFAVGPADAIDAMARTFAWQALAIDGVAQAAAHAALDRPQDWIEAARAELAEMRPRAIEAANATGVLRAELPEAAAFVWAAIDGDEEELSDRLAREHGITALPGSTSPPRRRTSASRSAAAATRARRCSSGSRCSADALRGEGALIPGINDAYADNVDQLG